MESFIPNGRTPTAENAKLCKNVQKSAGPTYAKNVQKYAKVFKNMQKNAKLCKTSRPGYAKICQNVQKYAKIFKKKIKRCKIMETSCCRSMPNSAKICKILQKAIQKFCKLPPAPQHGTAIGVLLLGIEFSPIITYPQSTQLISNRGCAPELAAEPDSV